MQIASVVIFALATGVGGHQGDLVDHTFQRRYIEMGLCGSTPDPRVDGLIDDVNLLKARVQLLQEHHDALTNFARSSHELASSATCKPEFEHDSRGRDCHNGVSM